MLVAKTCFFSGSCLVSSPLSISFPLRLSMDLYPRVWVTYPRVLAVAKVIPASPGKIDAGLPAQGVWYLHFWGLPLATRRPPQWLCKNCQRPLCPPPLCSLSPLSSSSKLLNNSALWSGLSANKRTSPVGTGTQKRTYVTVIATWRSESTTRQFHDEKRASMQGCYRQRHGTS